MPRALAGVLVALAVWAAAAAQELPVLHFNVHVVDADGKSMPVARHPLLISDEPVSRSPLRVITSADGTAQLRLRPGRYIIESDRPFILGTKTFEWMQRIEVLAGKDATLELTAANASVGAATADLAREAAATDRPVSPSSSILASWQASAFGLWTDHVHAAGI